jgi:hypothetical protein
MLRDEDIAALVKSRLDLTSGLRDNTLERERAETQRFYDGESPKPLHKGNSKYVSQDVFDAVESMKAQILETFSAHKRGAYFKPENADDVEAARIASEWSQYVFHRMNDGFHIIRDAVHNGLMFRNGVAKVWYEQECEEEEHEIEGLPTEAIEQLYANEKVRELDVELDEATGLYSGTVRVKRKNDKINIEIIPNEDFGISERAVSIESADITWQRCLKSKSELRDMGIEEAKLALLTAADETSYYDEELRDARHEDTGEGYSTSTDLSDSMQEATRKYTIYECYTQIDINNDGRAKLCKLFYSGGHILDKEEVERTPFIDWAPLPVPHRFWGSSYAKRVFPTQNARTLLTRSIIDHAMITNNPRYTVLNGGLANPRELMENRIGGIVNIKRQDAIAPLIQASLNPFVFQTVAMLDDDKEETTGISRLSQGLNKDALSSQNSAGMVENLINVSQVRQKVIARNFAQMFLRKMFLRIYELTLENFSGEQVFEVANNWVEVNPTTWKARKDASVEFNLGYGEKDKEVQKYMALDQFLTSDPELKSLYPMNKRYETVRRMAQATEIEDIDTYIENPRNVKPRGPNPETEMQKQVMAKQIELRERELDLKEREHAFREQSWQAELALKRATAEADHALRADKHDLEQEKADNSYAIAREEMALGLQTPEENLRFVVSPNG